MDGVFELVVSSMFGVHLLQVSYTNRKKIEYVWSDQKNTRTQSNTPLIQEKLLNGLETLKEIYCLEESIDQALRIQQALKVVARWNSITDTYQSYMMT